MHNGELPADDSDVSLRRVLFEVSRLEDGTITWHLDESLSVQGLMMLINTLDLARDELYDGLREVVRYGRE